MWPAVIHSGNPSSRENHRVPQHAAALIKKWPCIHYRTIPGSPLSWEQAKGFNCTGDGTAASGQPQHSLRYPLCFPPCSALSLLPVTRCPVLLPTSFCGRTINPLSSTQTDGQTGERVLCSLCTQTPQSGPGIADLSPVTGKVKNKSNP